MFALVAASTVSREPLMGSTNRRKEVNRNLRIAPQSAAPDLPAEPPVLVSPSPARDSAAERAGSWDSFLRVLLRALAAWHT
jgi:hypothetical protein